MNMHQYRVRNTGIVFLRGDITKQETGAIVNAANSTLLGGGGVDGAIQRAGGPQILEECKQIRTRQGECPTGEAVITTGGNLPAGYVIHTVGPIWRGGGHGELEHLRNAYRNSLQLARERGIRSISFPSISTGAYRFPIDRAATIAVDTVKKFAEEYGMPVEIRFVLFSENDLGAYLEAWDKLTKV